MELEQEFKDYIKLRYFFHPKQIKSPSAFTSIFYLKGYSGRCGDVRAAIEREIHRLQQSVVFETKMVKKVIEYETLSITFK